MILPPAVNVNRQPQLFFQFGQQIVVPLLYIDLANLGEVAAEEVVQVYISSPDAGEGYPLYELRKIERVALEADHSKQLKIELDAAAFMQVNEEGELFLPKGDYTIHVGGSVPSERSVVLGGAESVSTTVTHKVLKRL